MHLHGCYVAIVTPFDASGAIDEEGLRKNIRYLIAHGVAGIVPCGTTGESATLSWKEHNRIVDVSLEEAGSKVKVIAGAGSNNTAEAIEAAQHAYENRADAILCITPYYNRPTQEGLYQHYRAIAQKVPIPLIIYNVPSRTGVTISAETLERLCAFESIVGVKEASGNLLQVSEIHRRCGNRLAILSGDDALTLPVMACGGSGVISVIANMLPDRMVALVDAFEKKQYDVALRIHEELLPVCNALFIETNPIPIKEAMNYLGLAAGTLRLPMVAMSKNNKEALISVIEKLHIQLP
ncbi:MAG: 4-hydroxy-tetrahydrodipicolinate synthase [Chitinivibrionales bacterium]|nr:4-hydroxy-tetrahydrodipicolinate synthase [Chitinivibrionales bacterium]